MRKLERLTGIKLAEIRQKKHKNKAENLFIDAYLYMNDSEPQKELAEKLGITQPAVSYRLKRLMDKFKESTRLRALVMKLQ